MVLRLFVPPGEGQHQLVPKRPESIGANATLQYSIIGSTALAATYTSFATKYGQRVSPTQPISRTALFIRSSARLGLWAGVVGATVNWYYHKAFVGVVASERKIKLKPWKLYKWTKRRTVDDGCLAGAVFGLAASMPMLFMRRPALPRWMRCLGMTNIGACVGILGAHAYLHYTSERQKAYRRLDRRLKRRSLEFWAIFWDKELMARFNPLIQQYIRHNGIWYTYHLPDEVFDDVEAYGKSTTKKKISKPDAEAPEEEPYYTQPFDYAENLRQIDVDFTRAKMDQLKTERQDLLREAEYLLFIRAQKEYEYCHLKDMDNDERDCRQREIYLVQIAYNRVRAAATTIDTTIVAWEESLRHKAIFDAYPAGDDALAAWLPKSERLEYKTHDPSFSIQEMEKFQTQFSAEVKRFQELVKHPGYEKSRRERWEKDLEDGRCWLRAVDSVVWELEKRRKALVGMKGEEKAVSTTESVKQTNVTEMHKPLLAETKEQSTEQSTKDEPVEKAEVKKTEVAKPPGGGLEPDKP